MVEDDSSTSAVREFSTPRKPFTDELWDSTELLFQGRSTWLLALGPLAVVGSSLNLLSPSMCFCFAGLTLIPCAERLSYITEQVALHTNGTIGSLLNATFGNCPELLISIAALRAGFYRVVQLAMLGSILTNLILVFGVACLIGGLRWHVQELRITSGNVNVAMLFLATAGSLFPAVLIQGGQLSSDNSYDGIVATKEEVAFCRVNSLVMFVLYLCFLVFELGSHRDEFDDDDGTIHSRKRARRNLFCLRHLARAQSYASGQPVDYGPMNNDIAPLIKVRFSDQQYRPEQSFNSLEEDDMPLTDDPESEGWSSANEDLSRRRRQRNNQLSNRPSRRSGIDRISPRASKTGVSSASIDSAQPDDDHSHDHVHIDAPEISMRVGITWLFIITVCISAMSDILVDTIDDFARRMHISDVFVSFVIIPFFSNIAEQVSAFLFAYRNEMDLCVGVTVGSSIQVATFVLPGSVLIGALMDRSMTLYFRGYETVCFFFAVVVVGAVLQGGTTNWLVGAILVGIYIMMAAGVWFHELEDLSTDAELLIRNATST